MRRPGSPPAPGHARSPPLRPHSRAMVPLYRCLQPTGVKDRRWRAPGLPAPRAWSAARGQHVPGGGLHRAALQHPIHPPVPCAGCMHAAGGPARPPAVLPRPATAAAAARRPAASSAQHLAAPSSYLVRRIGRRATAASSGSGGSRTQSGARVQSWRSELRCRLQTKHGQEHLVHVQQVQCSVSPLSVAGGCHAFGVAVLVAVLPCSHACLLWHTHWHTPWAPVQDASEGALSQCMSHCGMVQHELGHAGAATQRRVQLLPWQRLPRCQTWYGCGRSGGSGMDRGRSCLQR